MILAIALLASLAVMADGISTCSALVVGAKEANPARAFLIQRLGIFWGTIGVSLACGIALLFSAGPLERLAGFHSAAAAFLMVTVACGWAAYSNWRR